MPLHDVGAAGALPFNVEGQQPPPTEDPLADVRIVAPGYFETMKIKLLAGRFLDERDGEKWARAPASSTRRWRGDTFRMRARSAASSRIRTARAKWWAWSATCTTRDSIDDPKKQVYLPLKQSPTAGMALVARTERDASSFGNAIQRAIWEVDPAQPIYELSTMDQILARAVFLPRLSTTLLAMFAIAALAARRARHLRRAVVFGVAADQGDWPADGARRIGWQHRRDDRPQQRGDGRDRRRDRT